METSAATNEFDLGNFPWLGFDMDHSLVRYKVYNLEKLVFGACINYFVGKGYPQSLKDHEFDNHFCSKGVVLDLENGNFLRLNDRGQVTKAIHGKNHPLNDEEITTLYGKDCKWDKYHILQQHKRVSEIIVFITYFDIPTAHLWALLIDLHDAGELPNMTNYEALRDDVWACLDYQFTPESFALNRGEFFPAIKADTGKYVMKDEQGQMAQFCSKLRGRGHKLALISNSRGDFATLLMVHTFGNNWRSMFDVVVFQSMKPTFFRASPEEQPYRMVDPDSNVTLEAHASDAFLGSKDSVPVVAQGTSQKLGEILGIGTPAQPCLYFGDQLHSDVVALPENWFAAAVVEELEQDLHTSEEIWGSFLGHVPGVSQPGDHWVPSHWASLLQEHAHVCIHSVHDFLEFHHESDAPVRRAISKDDHPENPNGPHWFKNKASAK